jgi:hypothetical protein
MNSNQNKSPLPRLNEHKIPEYKNDNHIVEKRLPLCEFCIETDRKSTIVPDGHLERMAKIKEQENRIKETDDLKKQVADLTALVQQLINK